MSTWNLKYPLVAFGFASLLSGCLGTKHLKENEKLLYHQSIQAPKHINEEDLRNLYTQRPNRRLMGLPIATLVSVYYMGAKNYDQQKYIDKKEAVEKKYDEKIARETAQKKINKYMFKKQKKVDKINSFIENGNLFMQWGEPLSIFDSSQVTLTKERFSSYLFSKGYFTNVISTKVNVQDKRVRVGYQLTPGRPYVIDSIVYDVSDTAIFNIIEKNKSESLLKRLTNYDQDNFTKERERMDFLLKDNGYYDFSRQYIDFEVDTTYQRPDRKVAIIVTIREPEKRGYHKKFTIDEITFTTDVGKTKPGIERKTETYRDIRYLYFNREYNPRTLGQRVFLKPGELYSRSRTINTQRQLGNVDAFKFININYDTSGGKFVANIFASPLSKNEWTNEVGLNVTQGFPGPFYIMSFKKRNIFKGMETFDLSGRFGFEGVAAATSSQQVYKSTEAGINASMTFPQFIFPLSERRKMKIAEYNPKTKFSAGYVYTDRPEYRRTAVIANGTYTWQNNRKTLFSFTPVNLGIIDTSNLSKDFKKLLAQQDSLGNNSLINSFRPSFVNSMIFTITWNINNYGNTERKSAWIRAQIESGGTIWNFIDPKVVTQLELEYFKYIRLSLDMRRVVPIDKNLSVAYRFNSGLAYSYSENESLPYEKFFFAGGSNSLRAWRPRRLGRGSASPPLSADPTADGLFDYSIEKPAEILLEGSIELRQKLFGFVSGAIFVDAGNVWNFRPLNVKTTDGSIVQDESSQFSLDRFYKEIAFGTGFGLRFDFTFLVLRFDVGAKVIDPARDKGDRFVLDKIKFWQPYATPQEDGTYTNYREPVIYNVGVGFPF